MNRDRKIERLFSRWDKKDYPGAAISVSYKGNLLYSNGFGCANLEYGIPITPQTIFHVASVSKQFTVMAILLLEKEGKLSIKDDIRKHLNELPEFEDIITIEHLINHTSGLRDQLELLFLSGWRPDDVLTQEHLMKMSMRQKTLNFSVGEEFLYSNTGYTFMAEIVEKTSGFSFREYVKTNIFEPLGMLDSVFHDDNDEIVKNRAYSYNFDEKGSIKKSVLSYSIVGPTSLFTTVQDMAKWGNNYFDYKVGGKEIIDYMTSKSKLNSGQEIEYAGGVSIKDYKGLKTIEHNGADAGFRTSMVIFKEKELVISVFSNIGTFKPEYYAKIIGELFIDEELIDKNNLIFDYNTLEIEPKDPNEFMDIKKIAGYYLVNSVILITANIKENSLYIKLPSTPELKFMHLRDNLLQGENTDILIKVVEDKYKNVIALNIINIPKDIIKADKIQIEKRDKNLLMQYIGKYYCVELDTFYKLEIEDNNLVATHRRHPITKFIAYGEDSFLSDTVKFGLKGKITFRKNEDKVITGFMLNSDRVKSLWFDRLNSGNGGSKNEIQL